MIGNKALNSVLVVNSCNGQCKKITSTLSFFGFNSMALCFSARCQYVVPGRMWWHTTMWTRSGCPAGRRRVCPRSRSTNTPSTTPSGSSEENSQTMRYRVKSMMLIKYYVVPICDWHSDPICLIQQIYENANLQKLTKCVLHKCFVI